MVTWDILVCSIAYRHNQLVRLLEELDGQMEPGVRVLLHRDNTELGYGDKCRLLLETATADYVSFFDDDDWPHPKFVHWLKLGMEKRPDYVGFQVHYLMDGRPSVPITHSITCGGWHNFTGELLRDIVHLNPIRRELALLGRWTEPGWQADKRWADDVRSSGKVQTEWFIPEPMYCKRDFSEGANFSVAVKRIPEDLVVPLPSYPWLVSIGS